MKIYLIAPDLESKFHKSPKGFKIPYPLTVFKPKNMDAKTLQLGRCHTAKKIHSIRSILRRIVGAKTNLAFPLLFNLSLRKLYKRLPSGI